MKYLITQIRQQSKAKPEQWKREGKYPVKLLGDRDERSKEKDQNIEDAMRWRRWDDRIYYIEIIKQVMYIKEAKIRSVRYSH